ncbi:hypothetical protein C7C46_09015 [Streptomyces tateyamensis]|uniref:Uncharacterized protein n=1 Tax=Streptomyces tateyamensis TaxID=565073 RepID=A0A2V4NLB8_9ACTN|nr:hypothetical protein [Streptomyces tateyamensis]PYC83462.1 hypothetical protein C7C46_09015 [Streptomyces tateyamensis]
MRTVTTVVAADQVTLTNYLDQLAAAEYLAARAGQAGPSQAGQPTAWGELWLLALARTSAATPGQWQVYALTSEDDLPGWPYSTSQYTGGIRTPADIARALAATGDTCVLRHYAGFTVTSATAETVTLN